MSNEKKNFLYSLISLDDFKALMGIDDRDDKIVRFCLVTSTLTIEQYCKRRFLKKIRNEKLDMRNENSFYLALREYPVIKIISVRDEKGVTIDSEFYRLIPDYGIEDDIPCSIEFNPLEKIFRWKVIEVVYWAGYAHNKVPADLASACMELAAWNLNRYKGKRIGIAGSIRKDGDRLEMAMPLQVRELLEPYRRKTI